MTTDLPPPSSVAAVGELSAMGLPLSGRVCCQASEKPRAWGAGAARADAAPAPHALGFSLAWQPTLPDNGNPIAESSPTAATLDGGGKSVVIGDRAGSVYAFHLS